MSQIKSSSSSTPTAPVELEFSEEEWAAICEASGSLGPEAFVRKATSKFARERHRSAVRLVPARSIPGFPFFSGHGAQVAASIFVALSFACFAGNRALIPGHPTKTHRYLLENPRSAV